MGILRSSTGTDTAEADGLDHIGNAVIAIPPLGGISDIDQIVKIVFRLCKEGAGFHLTCL